MKRGIFQIGCLLLLVDIALFNSIVPTVKSDIAIIGANREGITAHNGTSIEMPRADVEINITVTDSLGIEVRLDGNYTLVSEISQNVTVAFVYPKNPLQPPDEEPSDGYEIYVDGEKTEYILLMWEELDFEDMDSEVNFTGNWVFDAYFAAFDVCLKNGTITKIGVKHNIIGAGGMHYYSYAYIVGSARTFEGTTRQTVDIRVVENAPPLNISFDPKDNLTIWEGDSYTHANWDFIVQETSVDLVSVGVSLKEYIPPASNRFERFIRELFSEENRFKLMIFIGITSSGILVCVILYWINKQE
jgi:hypothetical protein